MSAILDALLNELVDGDDTTLARLADKLAPLLAEPARTGGFSKGPTTGFAGYCGMLQPDPNW